MSCLHRVWRGVLQRQSWATHKAASSFITTPIFYVNAAPHIGHLYSALLADATHRWRLIKGADPAVFSTGTDEHGMKIEKVAASQGRPPQLLCDEVASKFKGMFDRAGISYTHFIRTTEPHHIKKVEEVWNVLHERGHIYKGEYSGWYCVPDEAYLTETQVVHSPELKCKVSVESGHPVEWGSEENYRFRLTKFRDQLLEWATTPPYPIVPEFARRLVVGWLEDEHLSDLSVSRPRSRLKWGIPVPNDKSQTIYVWLDALVNYLTVSGHPLPNHTWPPTEHIVGKDILRFHAIYWPAFLLAAGLQLPEKIVAHCHWTVDRSKMSKSKGNVLDPMKLFSKYGVEQVRYYLLKESWLQHDTDYSEERLEEMVNSDLADTLGNLLSRISSERLITNTEPLKYDSTVLPFLGQDDSSQDKHALIKTLQGLPEILDKRYGEFQFRLGIEEVMDCLHLTNQFIQYWAPWLRAKDPEQHRTIATVLLVVMESLRLSACHLYPILPSHCSTLLQRLGCPATPTLDDLHCKLSEEKVHELEKASQQFLLNRSKRPLFKKFKV